MRISRWLSSFWLFMKILCLCWWVRCWLCRRLFWKWGFIWSCICICIRLMVFLWLCWSVVYDVVLFGLVVGCMVGVCCRWCGLGL